MSGDCTTKPLPMDFQIGSDGNHILLGTEIAAGIVGNKSGDRDAKSPLKMVLSWLLFTNRAKWPQSSHILAPVICCCCLMAV